jgi:hypothetical protein
MSISDNFTLLGNSIINKLKTRANRDLSNLSEAGRLIIENNSGGGGLEIGDIGIAPFGVNEAKNRRRYLNGQVISQVEFPTFTYRLKEAVTKYPTLACSEIDWQAIMSASDVKQCGKFVIDDTAKTIRLPKIIMPIQGLVDLGSLANIVKSGLPNITATWHNTTENQMWVNPSGAVYRISSSGDGVDGTNGWFDQIGFDASRCSAIYGRSSTVQPEHIQYPYFIQVSNGTILEETDVVYVDDLINELRAVKENSTIVEVYSNGSSWCKTYANGWCEQGAKVTSQINYITPVTLMQPYKDTNYTIISTGEGPNQGSGGNCGHFTIINSGKTATGFNLQTCSGHFTAYYWHTAGFIDTTA